MGVMFLWCCDFQNSHRFFPTGRIAFVLVKGIQQRQHTQHEIGVGIGFTTTLDQRNRPELMLPGLKSFDEIAEAC